MTTSLTPPDFLKIARDHADRGNSEVKALAIIADAIKRKIAASDNEGIRFHLGLDLANVLAEIGPAMERDIQRPVRRAWRRR